MTQGPNANELNAYVDGELSPGQATRIADAIARDRELACEVAALLRLKSATIDAFAATPPQLPEVSISRPNRARWWLAAAVVALSLLAGAVASTMLDTHAPTSADRVASVIDVWKRDNTPDRAQGGDLPLPGLKDAALKGLWESLEATQLRVWKTDAVAGGLALDLVGPSGCRLALWIGPTSIELASSKTLGSPLRAGTAVVWTAADWHYLLVSLNAPRDKFAAFASALQTATQAPSLPRESALAVAEARKVGPPCVG